MDGDPKPGPLISILIPSYNHERYVEQTIRSIWSQPYRQVEIIVIDDRSSDGSLALLKRLQAESPVKMEVLVNDFNIGPAATQNRAIHRANGELISVFASDDYYAEDAFSPLVRKFQSDGELQIVYGNGYRFDDARIRGPVHRKKAKRLFKLSAPEILDYLYANPSPLYLQTALLKKELMLNVGCYDESLKADDWAISIKIFQELVRSEGGFAFCDMPVFYYRKHQANLHRNSSRQFALQLEVIEKLTPDDLRRTARANILFGGALQAVKDREYSLGFDLFRQSQRQSFAMKKLIKFIRKFAHSATLGRMVR